MNNIVNDFIEYAKNTMPKHNKEKAIQDTLQHFTMTKDGKVYYTDYFATRFLFF